MFSDLRQFEYAKVNQILYWIRGFVVGFHASRIVGDNSIFYNKQI